MLRQQFLTGLKVVERVCGQVWSIFAFADRNYCPIAVQSNVVILPRQQFLALAVDNAIIAVGTDVSVPDQLLICQRIIALKRLNVAIPRFIDHVTVRIHQPDLAVLGIDGHAALVGVNLALGQRKAAQHRCKNQKKSKASLHNITSFI